MSHSPLSSELHRHLSAILGESGIRSDDSGAVPSLVLKPANTEQVAAILKACNEAGQALIPIGGRTGLAGALLPLGDELGLSLERMNAIEEVDTLNRTITVQAGCILQVAAEAAEQHGLLLPLDLGARGSATIGGNVATNAGGNRVIRYGMMRDMVLGMEVVMADGTVLSTLNKMIKNNAGYDLKQLFIGAEGTLGVITKVVLRLRPKPVSQNTALLAVQDFQSVLKVLHQLDAKSAGTLSAFEVMWPSFYEHITRAGGNHRPPLPHGSQYYVLVETLGADQEQDKQVFEENLYPVLEQGIATDAVIAQSQAERNAIWEIRDDVFELFGLGPCAIFDISVTVDKIEAFVDAVHESVADLPDPICVVFGHLGDCNLHVMAGTKDINAFDKAKIEQGIYEVVRRMGGSVSAEHGVGIEKKPYLDCTRSDVEIALMKHLKHSLDPNNILNPHKIISIATPAEKA